MNVKDLVVGNKYKLSDYGWDVVKPNTKETSRAATEGFTLLGVLPGEMIPGVQIVIIDGPLSKFWIDNMSIEEA